MVPTGAATTSEVLWYCKSCGCYSVCGFDYPRVKGEVESRSSVSAEQQKVLEW